MTRTHALQGGLEPADGSALSPRLVGDLKGEVELAAIGTGSLRVVLVDADALELAGTWIHEDRRVVLVGADDPEDRRELTWVDGTRSLALVMNLGAEKGALVFVEAPR